MFSAIVQRFDAGLNALYRERDARKARGQKIIDLVSGNVNRAGFIFPPEILRQALTQGARQARLYAPDPLGQSAAREVIRYYYHTEGLKIPASQIVLTPGTSLSYLYLFKLLANPGDEILCPRPSYPLLDSIADFCHVRLTGYRLLEKNRWEIDLDHLRSVINSKTRAIVLISPHNPTGAVATNEEIAGLVQIAAQHGLPIISDEVFSAFLFNQRRLPRPAHPHLAFTLNGVSKMFALPGMKIGWIAVTGDPDRVQKAVQALDMISDTFLPVNEAAQFALPVIFSKGRSFLTGVKNDIARRAEMAAETLKRFSFVKPEGGFYLTLKIPGDEEKTALELLKKEGILVHPGYFYDMEDAHMIISFISPPEMLRSSLRKISVYL